ncbi:hypothetical protein PsAD14_02174 [Pseudovibrio sp. Ad14]|nr:hypothetical protein PsAD14_02174 [Pseudovibrio sp. Ad14]
MSVPPVQELLPDRMVTPLPSNLTLPLPIMSPASVKFPFEVMKVASLRAPTFVTSISPFTVTFPLETRLPPKKSRSPFPTALVLVTTTVAPSSKNILPVKRLLLRNKRVVPFSKRTSPAPGVFEIKSATRWSPPPLVVLTTILEPLTMMRSSTSRYPALRALEPSSPPILIIPADRRTRSKLGANISPLL